MFIVWKSIFNFHFIDNLKKPACTSRQDRLVLKTNNLPYLPAHEKLVLVSVMKSFFESQINQLHESQHNIHAEILFRSGVDIRRKFKFCIDQP